MSKKALTKLIEDAIKQGEKEKEAALLVREKEKEAARLVQIEAQRLHELEKQRQLDELRLNLNAWIAKELPARIIQAVRQGSKKVILSSEVLVLPRQPYIDSKDQLHMLKEIFDSSGIGNSRIVRPDNHVIWSSYNYLELDLSKHY